MSTENPYFGHKQNVVLFFRSLGEDISQKTMELLEDDKWEIIDRMVAGYEDTVDDFILSGKDRSEFEYDLLPSDGDEVIINFLLKHLTSDEKPRSSRENLILTTIYPLKIRDFFLRVRQRGTECIELKLIGE